MHTPQHPSPLDLLDLISAAFFVIDPPVNSVHFAKYDCLHFIAPPNSISSAKSHPPPPVLYDKIPLLPLYSLLFCIPNTLLILR